MPTTYSTILNKEGDSQVKKKRQLGGKGLSHTHFLLPVQYYFFLPVGCLLECQRVPMRPKSPGHFFSSFWSYPLQTSSTSPDCPPIATVCLQRFSFAPDPGHLPRPKLMWFLWAQSWKSKQLVRSVENHLGTCLDGDDMFFNRSHQNHGRLKQPSRIYYQGSTWSRSCSVDNAFWWSSSAG